MMGVCVKLLFMHNPTITKYELIYWRGFAMLFLGYGYIVYFGADILGVPKKYRKIMMFRSIIGYWGLQGVWGAYEYMPLDLA